MLLAPGLFRTTTGTPKAADNGGEIARAKTSDAPPGAKVTMIRIGLLGQASALVALFGRMASNANKIDISFKRESPVNSVCFWAVRTGVCSEDSNAAWAISARLQCAVPVQGLTGRSERLEILC